MLRPENGYLFVEVVEGESLENKGRVILDDNLSRDHIVKARVFNDYTAGMYLGKYNDGDIVLCDTVGAREFVYNGRELKIINDDRVFGVFYTEPKKSKGVE